MVVPGVMPETTPVPDIVAVPGMLLLQVPPVVDSNKVMVEPSQTVCNPEIGNGTAFTVTTIVAMQPVGRVYEIVAVPGVPPVTTPAVLTIAIPGALLLQAPPRVVSVSIVVWPAHTTGVPSICDTGFTTTGAITAQPVPSS